MKICTDINFSFYSDSKWICGTTNMYNSPYLWKLLFLSNRLNYKFSINLWKKILFQFNWKTCKWLIKSLEHVQLSFKPFIPFLGPTTAITGVLVVKNLPANTGDSGNTDSIPGAGTCPGGESGHPLQCSCLGNPMDRGLAAYSPWGCRELDTTKCVSIHASILSLAFIFFSDFHHQSIAWF